MVAVITAVMLAILLGFVGLAVDIPDWYRTRRALQNAADSAAIAAALNGSDTYQEEAKAISARYGFVDGSAGVTVTALDDQACPGGHDLCYRVTISDSSPPTFFAEILGAATPVLSGTAVATASQGGNACVLALDDSASGAITMNGNVDVNLSCGIAINSSSPSALSMNGSVSLTATSANIVGGIRRNGVSTLSVPEIKTGAEPIADPYADTDVPPFWGCDYTGARINGSGTATLNPGVYCGDIIINGGVDVILNPGTYILDRGSFIINGNPTLTGDGVAIVLTSSTGTGIGSFSDSGNPTVHLTAEGTDFGGLHPLPGFIIFQDPRASSGGSNTFNGTPDSILDGALYFPNQRLVYNGAPTGGPGCTQIVARTITMNGHLGLDQTMCASRFGLAAIGGATPELVQ